MEVRTPLQHLLFNTVRIETHDRDNKPIGVGTSFILSHNFEGHGDELFLVSNNHVIEDAFLAYMYFTEMKDGKVNLGKPFFIKSDFFSIGWIRHPSEDVDLAIMPLSWQLDMIEKGKGGGMKAFYEKVSTEIIPHENEINDFDAVEPVIFIGYPNGIFDRKHYTPIVRRGTTATPIQLDYDGDPIFLIDAPVFPGSSGSPVFLYKQPIHSPSDEPFIAETYITLIGILSAVFFRTELGTVEMAPAPSSIAPTVEIREMIDLGVVLKSHLILDPIDIFWREHEEKCRQWKKDWEHKKP
jgi:hypothetical protein